MMKKILPLILVCLFLVSGVLAATVTISPNPAHDRDDLTCAVDGKTTGFLYYWLIDGNQAGSKNPLPASRTSAGDNVVCKVYAPSPFGEMYMGETSIVILPDNRAPTVAILLPKENSVFGIGDSVTFSAVGFDADGDSLTYSWAFGDGKSATGKSTEHVFTKEGEFKASVTVRDSKGASGTDSVNFKIAKSAVNHAPSVSIKYPEENDKFTTEASITFIADANDQDGDSLVYMWDFGDSSTSKEQRPSHTYTKDANYNVKLTVSDGKLTASDSVKIQVIKKIYDIKGLNTYSDEYVTPADVFFRGEDLYAKFSVKERTTGKAVSGLDIDTYIYNAKSGSGRVYLKGFTGIADGKVIFNGEPILSDGNYYFMLNALPLDDSLLGKDVVFVIAYKLPNGGGQDQKFIQVLNNPVQLMDLPDVNVPLNGYDRSIDLDNYVSDKETPDSEIKWTVTGSNDVKVSIDSATRVVTFTSSVAGAVERITFTADDGDGSFASKTLTARVVENPDMLKADIAGGDRTVYVGDVVGFDGSGSTGPITEYRWDFGDGAVAEGRTLDKASHVFDSTGVYTVTLTVSISDRISNSDSVKVTVLEKEPDTNDYTQSDYDTEDREHKFAYLHGSEHSFDFGKIAPLYYKPSYEAGSNVRMIFELRNSGYDELLDLKVYVPGAQAMLFFNNIHLDAGQNKYIDANVKLPDDLKAGAHVLKAVASNREDNVERTAYWVFVVVN